MGLAPVGHWALGRALGPNVPVPNGPLGPGPLVPMGPIPVGPWARSLGPNGPEVWEGLAQWARVHGPWQNLPGKIHQAKETDERALTTAFVLYLLVQGITGHRVLGQVVLLKSLTKFHNMVAVQLRTG